MSHLHVVFFSNEPFYLFYKNNLWFFFLSLRRNEEECFRGVHIFSSRRPPCAIGAFRVPHQEVIREEPDLPWLGIPHSHLPRCTPALRTRCMSSLMMLLMTLSFSHLMLWSRRSEQDKLPEAKQTLCIFINLVCNWPSSTSKIHYFYYLIMEHTQQVRGRSVVHLFSSHRSVSQDCSFSNRKTTAAILKHTPQCSL